MAITTLDPKAIQAASDLTTAISDQSDHLRTVLSALMDPQIASVALDLATLTLLQGEYQNAKAALLSLVQKLP